MTQNQKDIITDLIIDNGLIYEDIIKNIYEHPMLRINSFILIKRVISIISYCHTLFMETVYDETVDDTDYVQMRIANLLAAIANYRDEYNKGSYSYIVMNSFFDKTSESFNNFNDTL